MKSLSTRYFLTSSAILTACKESTYFDDRPSLLPLNIAQALPESKDNREAREKIPHPTTLRVGAPEGSYLHLWYLCDCEHAAD